MPSFPLTPTQSREVLPEPLNAEPADLLSTARQPSSQSMQQHKLPSPPGGSRRIDRGYRSLSPSKSTKRIKSSTVIQSIVILTIFILLSLALTVRQHADLNAKNGEQQLRHSGRSEIKQLQNELRAVSSEYKSVTEQIVNERSISQSISSARGEIKQLQNELRAVSSEYKSVTEQIAMTFGEKRSIIHPSSNNSKQQPASLDGISLKEAARSSIGHRMEPFCQKWDSSAALNRTAQPFDKWFTHHPTWVVTNETDEKFCVEPGNAKEHPHIRGLAQYYANQFHSSCDHVHIRTRWSAGWGSDFMNMQGGLLYALNNHVPLILKDSGKPWHYSANKNDSSALTCEEGDTTCYFLPYHDCGTSSAEYWEKKHQEHKVQILEGETELPEECGIADQMGRDAYMFLTRKLLWLRRAVFDYKQNFKKSKNITEGANSDCTVVHVRRSDVILHNIHARRYFPVADYVKLIPSEKLSNPDHHIFFLTDDANAIEEAHEFFPALNWKYFDRPRYKGSEGGWENQTPSRNPALEVVVLLATFELAQECSAFVHGQSNFAEYIYEQVSHCSTCTSFFSI